MSSDYSNKTHVFQALLEHTVSLRLPLNPDQRAGLEVQDRRQALWMADEQGRLLEAEREEFGGRSSGPVDWRARRDELGSHMSLRPKFEGMCSFSAESHLNAC